MADGAVEVDSCLVDTNGPRFYRTKTRDVKRGHTIQASRLKLWPRIAWVIGHFASIVPCVICWFAKQFRHDVSLHNCGVAFPMEWMCVATYLLNAESINACRCGVANKSRMIWRWLVLIGWATVWRQQQGSDQASRYSSASLLTGRRWRVLRERALVNNSAIGVCILLCVVATCVVSRVTYSVTYSECCK